MYLQCYIGSHQFFQVIWTVCSVQNIGAKTLNKTWHLLCNNHRRGREPKKYRSKSHEISKGSNRSIYYRGTEKEINNSARVDGREVRGAFHRE